MGAFFVKDPKGSSANSPNVPYCNYFLQQLILAIWKESLNIVLSKISCFQENTAKQKEEVLFCFLFIFNNTGKPQV
jgi:hypothetical protein